MTSRSRNGATPIWNHHLARWRFLRIRVAPPESAESPSVSTVGELCDSDAPYRTEMAENLFFGARTISPNLSETGYAFAWTDLLGAQDLFHKNLLTVCELVASVMPTFMPLIAKSEKTEDVYLSIPSSIQY